MTEIRQLLCWRDEKSCASILVLCISPHTIASYILARTACTHLLNQLMAKGDDAAMLRSLLMQNAQMGKSRMQKAFVEASQTCTETLFQRQQWFVSALLSLQATTVCNFLGVNKSLFSCIHQQSWTSPSSQNTFQALSGAVQCSCTSFNSTAGERPWMPKKKSCPETSRHTKNPLVGQTNRI